MKNSTAPSARVSLSVQYTCGANYLPSRAQIRRWVCAAAERDIAFGLRFVNEREAQAMNAQFRRKAYPTNVLTFIYETAPQVQGDIALCPAVIAREARLQKKALKNHYAHLVVHGVLHLQGYDHENARDAKIMEERERVILARFKITDPYA